MKLKLFSFLFVLISNHGIQASERNVQNALNIAIKYYHPESVERILLANPHTKVEFDPLIENKFHLETSKIDACAYGFLSVTSAVMASLCASSEAGIGLVLVLAPIACLTTAKAVFHGKDWYTTHKIQELLTNHQNKQINEPNV